MYAPKAQYLHCLGTYVLRSTSYLKMWSSGIHQSPPCGRVCCRTHCVFVPHGYPPLHSRSWRWAAGTVPMGGVLASPPEYIVEAHCRLRWVFSKMARRSTRAGMHLNSVRLAKPARNTMSTRTSVPLRAVLVLSLGT
jgi:hypothetical protein